MKLNTNILKLLTGIFLVSILAACKSASLPASSNRTITKAEEVFFSSLIDNSFDFNTFAANVKIEIKTADKELASKASLKMKKNLIIQLSVQPFLGIEAFRLEFTKDSLKFIDRLNKYYVLDSYENAKGDANVNFNFQNLQALFSNNIFVSGETEITENEFKRFTYNNRDGKTAELTLKDATGLIYKFIADSDEKLITTIFRDQKDNVLNWTYSDFKNVNNRQFPMMMSAGLLSGDKKQGSVTISFSEPDINKQFTTDFKIPSGYKRVTVSQIIKSLEIK